ncbi:hypothetical protein C2S52_019866 [Perilla frutescens var. hirtella]|nr:hypothetical protein C2S52_019866 [Perilla frutescens var. hirtella]
MLEGIRLSLMTRQYDMVKSLHSSVDVLCPNIRKKIERIQSLVKFCNLRPALGGKYEVHMDGDSYIVDLGSKECSCRWWMLTATYNNHALTPSSGPDDWEYVHGPPILPPEYVKLPGRPKKNRRKDPTEELKSGRKKWTKAGVKMSCHKCGQFGHNTRTCKEEVPTITLKPKGKRGRPKKGVQSSMRQTYIHGNGAGNIYFRGARQVNRRNVSPAQIQENC